MQVAQPKINIRRTFFAKLYFDFIAGNVTIELGFSQEVAAEALKNPPKLSFRWRSRDGGIGAGFFYGDGNQILASKESRNNGYVKRKAVDHPNRHRYLLFSRSQSSYSQAYIKLSIDDEVNRIAKQLQRIVQRMLSALFMIEVLPPELAR